MKEDFELQQEFEVEKYLQKMGYENLFQQLLALVIQPFYSQSFN